jgi:hypothetical protein
MSRELFRNGSSVGLLGAALVDAVTAPSIRPPFIG